ncbi:hypothetical protein EKO27_g960 [Xylaria grammica]|uniref:Uncharacterized protein n=1 Tax=Xylaria grammica TaxID=363999 RepID=A0A439DIA6_9PEZI|nr:hypothetical protein EKO27_g960 [Xylaria grammica]
MRASTLTVDFVSVGLLLGYLPGLSALPSLGEPIDKRNVFDEDGVELPDYDLYGGPPADRGAYDYVITITYGGYGPPPPPPSSSVVSMPPSSYFNQSITGVASPTAMSSSFSSTPASVLPGALYFARK